MKNIIVIAYQLHYSRGSECAVAMDYIRHISKSHKLTVLYGSSGGHHDIGNTDEMEAWSADHPMENVHFVPVKPSFKNHNWGFSLSGIRKFYEEYRLWHEDVYNIVADLLKKRHYDLVHFFGPIGFHEPGRLYELPVPYVWGPLGGMGNVPVRLLLASDMKYGIGGGIKLIVKSLVAKWRLRTNKRVQKALCMTDVVVGATTTYIHNIERAISKRHHSVIRYLPENCMNNVYSLNREKFKNEKINLLYIGSMQTRKAPMIILESLAKMGHNRHQFHIDFLGDGPMKAQCIRYAEDKGLKDIVSIHGKVEREEVLRMLENAQLMLLPSLSDANTTVVWEAMAHAVPTMCLDHCGMHDTIKEGSGIKIPISTYDSVVSAWAVELNKIAESPIVLSQMAEQLLTDRQQYTWERRMTIFNEIFTLAEDNFKNRKR